MSDNETLGFDDAHERAFAMLDARDGDYAAIPQPVAHFLRVQGAQGIIDNGGYRYFFEKDWEGTPPYQEFVDAYTAIGCQSQAEDLARVVATFPFDAPHLDEGMRNRFIEEFFDKESYSVLPWGDALCGDEEVWERLEEYVNRHLALFEPI